MVTHYGKKFLFSATGVLIDRGEKSLKTFFIFARNNGQSSSSSPELFYHVFVTFVSGFGVGPTVSD